MFILELTFLMELMLIKQANQKSVIFFTIGIFQVKDLDFKRMFARLSRFVGDVHKS